MYSRISSYMDETISFHHVCYADSRQVDISPHSHDVLELIFVKKGDITYTVDERQYQVSDNSIIITRPNKIHSITFNDPYAYDRYVIIFDRSIIRPEIYDRPSKDVDVLTFKDPANMVALFEKIDFYYRHFDRNDFKYILINAIEEMFYNIIIALEYYPETVFYNKYTANHILTEAIRYINQKIHTSFSLDEMCQELHISKSYLHKLFDGHMKVSPKKYIISRRLALAQRELKAGEKPTEVYLKYGYSDYSTFYREYKNHFGSAPSEEADRKMIREIID